MSLLDRVSRFIDDVLLLPEDLRADLEAAEDALDDQRWADAAALFDRVLTERNTIARAAVGLAQAREALGDLPAARRALVRARELEPDDAEVALFDARLALRDGDAARAAESARDAASRLANVGGPALARACVLRARAERARKRPDRAARELKKALSLSPDDHAIRAELVEVLAQARRPSTARAVATGLDPTSVDDAAANRVGLALDAIGAHDLARPWLERGANAGSDAALVALARRALAEGRVEDAEHLARRAVARGAGGDALALLAEVVLTEGRPSEATEALAAAAAARGGDPELMRAAARIAPLDAPSALESHADALERVAPNDPAARAARALAAVARDDPHAAKLLVADAGNEPRLSLARAHVALAEADPKRALVHLDAWAAEETRVPFASSDRAHVEELRRRALVALWRSADGDVDLAAAIDAVERFAREHQLSDAERAAARLRDELDRPLLLAVLGEFNAGKSTFINAFVGADVAPTGIVPTTATLNVLRGGAERRVRVVRNDGTTREGSWEDLKPLLAQAETDAHAGAVDHVEIVLPSETLERVWILDTPGTNAIDPDHERLAREAARRADAALWIFDAGQAGKGTEAKMLGAIRASGRAVVPVLNKVDRLKPNELERVLGVLHDELGEIGSAVPIAGKRALKARIAGDEASYGESGFADLVARLERDIFSRSRELKRGACASRLLAILDGALESESSTVASFDERVAALDAAEAPLRDADRHLDRALDEATASLGADLDVAFVQAAEEVLAFVKPRTNRFARHGADPEDRAFLADALEQRLGTAADALGVRLVARARGILAEATASLALDPKLTDHRVRAAVYGPLSLYVGFQRGLLRGGALRRFFDDVLPSADLERDSLAQALGAARADPTVELRPGLAEALGEVVASLEEERQRAIETQRREREAARSRVYAPLRALREVLAELL